VNTPDPEVLADLEDWDRLGLTGSHPTSTEPPRHTMATVAAEYAAWRQLLDGEPRQPGELALRLRFVSLLANADVHGRVWGLFRPGCRVLAFKGTAWPTGQYRPGDRLVWRAQLAKENAWVDAETSVPLNGSLAWPPEVLA
jgi:hypothetical protein